MKKIILFAIILAAGFYMAWPAYSLYQIADGVKVKDESKLQHKIAWQSVRSSLREPVTKRVKKEIGNQTKSQGIEGAIMGQLAGEFAPQLVEKILDAYVTPKGIIMLANQGGNINTADLGIGGLVQNLRKNNAGNDGGDNTSGGLLGGILDKANEIAGKIPGGKELVGNALGTYGKDLSETINKNSAKKSGSSAKTQYVLNNIKSITFNGPLNFEVGLAKSPTARKADVIAGMSFVDMDWKLSKIVPTF
jgi:hypothetical protein